MTVATEEQVANSSYSPGEKPILRISKSSFMGYNKCPRQFWWRYVSGVPSPPPGEAAIRGTAIHTVMEVALIDGPDAIPAVAADNGVDEMAGLIHSIAATLGGLDVVEVEEKRYLYEDFVTDNLGIVPVIWSGMIDGVLRHPDGGLIIVELKTGNMNPSKLSRTRKELVFYRRMLEQAGMDEVSHFLYIAPDCTDDRMLDEVGKRGKTVWLGENCGIVVLEPVPKRSLNLFPQSLNDTVENIVSRQWPMKWNDYFCAEWCDFSMSCEGILAGITEDVV
jgi:CRISPR/Cas system-associated exonuclease Cas4 (RecB family)